MSSKGIVRARCRDCAWAYERSLEAGDELPVEENQDIAQRVIRNHEYNCGEPWGPTAEVDRDLVLTGDAR